VCSRQACLKLLDESSVSRFQGLRLKVRYSTVRIVFAAMLLTLRKHKYDRLQKFWYSRARHPFTAASVA
jgi:hypothetical protein